MRTSLMGSVMALAVMAAAVGGSAVVAAPVAAAAGYAGVSRPSGDVTLSFIRPGRVREMAVKEGEVVKAGQVVAQQDDVEEQAQLAVDKADAEDETEINVNIALRDQDKINFERVNATGAGQSEKDDARVKVTVDEARILFAQHKQKTARMKVQATEAVLSKLKVVSPIDGVVAETARKVGEVADGQNMKVMRVIQVDPLWVEAPVKILEARKLKNGDAAQVVFMDEKVRVGRVSFISPIGDSGSETINVRVEVPNPEKIQPGENVRVTFGGEGRVAESPVRSR